MRIEKNYRLMIKVKNYNYKVIEAKILDIHTDRVPEIIKLDIKGRLENYLDWVRNN